MKTNPLNHIKIASPCSANWDEMVGDAKKRFCGDCKLNVYNLSGMTKVEAENLLMDAEGRLCVRFYRRSDGSVITQDCPVGWAKVKRNLSRAATAFASLIIGLFAGIFAFNASKKSETYLMGDREQINSNVRVDEDRNTCPPAIMGNVAIMGTPIPIRAVKGEVVLEKVPVKNRQNRQP